MHRRRRPLYDGSILVVDGISYIYSMLLVHCHRLHWRLPASIKKITIDSHDVSRYFSFWNAFDYFLFVISTLCCFHYVFQRSLTTQQVRPDIVIFFSLECIQSLVTFGCCDTSCHRVWWYSIRYDFLRNITGKSPTLQVLWRAISVLPLRVRHRMLSLFVDST